MPTPYYLNYPNFIHTIAHFAARTIAMLVICVVFGLHPAVVWAATDHDVAAQATDALARCIIDHADRRSGAIHPDALQQLLAGDLSFNPVWAHQITMGKPLSVGQQHDRDTAQRFLDIARDAGGLLRDNLHQYLKTLQARQHQEQQTHTDATEDSKGRWIRPEFVPLPGTDIAMQHTMFTNGMAHDLLGYWPQPDDLVSDDGQPKATLRVGIKGERKQFVPNSALADFPLRHVTTVPRADGSGFTVFDLVHALNGKLPADSPFVYDIATLAERRLALMLGLQETVDPDRLKQLDDMFIDYGHFTPAALGTETFCAVAQQPPLYVDGHAMYDLVGLGYELVTATDDGQIVPVGENSIIEARRRYQAQRLPGAHSQLQALVSALTTAPHFYSPSRYTMRLVRRPRKENQHLNYRVP